MNSIIIYIIAINLILAFKLWWDWRVKEKQKRIINHLKSAVIDGSLYVVLIVLLFMIRDGLHWIQAVGILALTVDYRWIAFDALFAKIIWGKWDFHGKSSKIDVFLNRFGKYHYLIKLIPAAIGIGLIKYEKVIIVIQNIWEILF